MKTLIVASALVAACGGDSESFTIVVQTDTPPALLALRDGVDAAWQQVPSAAGTYLLDVHGPYAVTLVCDFPTTEFPGLIDIELYERTPDDERTIASSCADAPPRDGRVTGHMVQAGAVSVGFGAGQTAFTPEWDFDIAVGNGAHQLVAVADERILRRELAVAGRTATPPIDVAKDGTALVAAPLGATNASASESVVASINLVTRDQTFARIYGGNADGALVVPDALLGGDDQQRARVTAIDGDRVRSVLRRDLRAGDARDVVLPEPLGPVEFAVANNVLTTTWSTLPAHDDEVTAELDSASGELQQFIFYFASVSNAYMAASGETGVTFATDLPGFDARWIPDLALEYTRDVSVAVRTEAETRTSSVTENVNAPETAVSSGNGGPVGARSDRRVSSSHDEHDEMASAGRLRLRDRYVLARRQL